MVVLSSSENLAESLSPQKLATIVESQVSSLRGPSLMLEVLRKSASESWSVGEGLRRLGHAPGLLVDAGVAASLHHRPELDPRTVLGAGFPSDVGNSRMTSCMLYRQISEVSMAYLRRPRYQLCPFQSAEGQHRMRRRLLMELLAEVLRRPAR